MVGNFHNLGQKKGFGSDEPIKCQNCLHIETSQFICTANQLTGFCMRLTLALNELAYYSFSVLWLLIFKTFKTGKIYHACIVN